MGKIKTTHYGKYPYGIYYTACGLLGPAFCVTNKATRRKSKVTCKNCRRTEVFKGANKL